MALAKENGQGSIFESRDDYENAVAQVLAAAHAYYETEVLLIDDATYDTLVSQITACEEAHPDWKTVDVLSVAAGVSKGGDVDHSEAMLSLDKAHTTAEVEAFLARFAKLAGNPTPELTVEVKLDGVALAARYSNGTLVQVITRGDGRTGEDVTSQIATGKVTGMPLTVPHTGTFEVRGECVLTSAQFETANTLRVDVDAKAAFVNRRNAVAGSVRAKDRGYALEMTFGAYSLHGLALAETATNMEQMSWLAKLGFAPAMFMAGPKGVVVGAANVEAAIADIGKIRASLDFEIDGAVVKANLPSDRTTAGSTGSHPRWAVAFKYPAEERTTVVLAIDITPGRTGLLVPRAVLEPVFVAGTTISFATLHNPGEVQRLDVRVGDTVLVKRAGDVIPRIEGVLLSARKADSVPWAAPDVCPRCGSGISKEQKRWRCNRGRACGAVELLTYAASRDALDIEGLGDTLANRLVEQDMVVDLAGVFRLTTQQLAAMDRMGEASASKLVAQIEAAKTRPLNRWITALGLRMTGRRMGRRLATRFGTLEAFRAATLAELAEVEGVGDIRAQSIFDEMIEIGGLIDELVGLGVSPEPATSGAEVATTVVLPFVKNGVPMTVVVSGAVAGMSRNEANEAVELLGGVSSGSVSKKTSLLVAGPGSGSKSDKARELGVSVIESEVFAELVSAHTSGAKARVTEILAGLS